MRSGQSRKSFNFIWFKVAWCPRLIIYPIAFYFLPTGAARHHCRCYRCFGPVKVADGPLHCSPGVPHFHDNPPQSRSPTSLLCSKTVHLVQTFPRYRSFLAPPWWIAHWSVLTSLYSRRSRRGLRWQSWLRAWRSWRWEFLWGYHCFNLLSPFRQTLRQWLTTLALRPTPLQVWRSCYRGWTIARLWCQCSLHILTDWPIFGLMWNSSQFAWRPQMACQTFHIAPRHGIWVLPLRFQFRKQLLGRQSNVQTRAFCEHRWELLGLIMDQLHPFLSIHLFCRFWGRTKRRQVCQQPLFSRLHFPRHQQSISHCTLEDRKSEFHCRQLRWLRRRCWPAYHAQLPRQFQWQVWDT